MNLSPKVIETTLVFQIFFKVNLFRAKIASALKGPFLTAPFIKYGTNCHACLSTKLWFEELFALHIQPYQSSRRTKHISLPFESVFHTENY